MSQPAVENLATLARFRPDFNLKKAYKTYLNNGSTFAEGALCRGAFRRENLVEISAKLSERGVIKSKYDETYTLPVKLSKKDIGDFEVLEESLREVAARQISGDDEPWIFMPTVKGENIWNVKIRLNQSKDFQTEVNRGTVNSRHYEGTGEIGDKVNIVGAFSIWMNPQSGTYGVKFDAKQITF